MNKVKNYIKTYEGLFFCKYMYFDDHKKYYADKIFKRRDLKVKFYKDYTMKKEDKFVIVYIRIRKRNEEKFLECMKELSTEIYLKNNGLIYNEYCEYILNLLNKNEE